MFAYALMATVFIIGYLCIALEHPLKIDKAASAILTAVLCWTVLVLGADSILPELASSGSHGISSELRHHLGEVSEILFFLLGAMTIVELIDAHEGFKVITDRIRTSKRVQLLWMVGFITFFLSAALDNLTTTIVMVSLLRKLIKDQHERWFYAGIVVIAANAGGAWSPIGDVTTTMLWIGHQITASGIIVQLIIPSIVCLLVPLLVLSFTLKGGLAEVDGLIRGLQRTAFAPSLAGVASSITHPGKTSHRALSAEALAELDIHEGTIRVSVGIEDAADIIGDFVQALDRL